MIASRSRSLRRGLQRSAISPADPHRAPLGRRGAHGRGGQRRRPHATERPSLREIQSGRPRGVPSGRSEAVERGCGSPAPLGDSLRARLGDRFGRLVRSGTRSPRFIRHRPGQPGGRAGLRRRPIANWRWLGTRRGPRQHRARPLARPRAQRFFEHPRGPRNDPGRAERRRPRQPPRLRGRPQDLGSHQPANLDRGVPTTVSAALAGFRAHRSARPDPQSDLRRPLRQRCPATRLGALCVQRPG